MSKNVTYLLTYLTYAEKQTTTTLTNKLYRGHYKVTEEEGAEEHLEKRSGIRRVDSGLLQVQLEENGDGIGRQRYR